MLRAAEDSSVGAVSSRPERDLHDYATRVRHLDTIVGHCITLVIEAEVHVLEE